MYAKGEETDPLASMQRSPLHRPCVFLCFVPPDAACLLGRPMYCPLMMSLCFSFGATENASFSHLNPLQSCMLHCKYLAGPLQIDLRSIAKPMLLRCNFKIHNSRARPRSHSIFPLSNMFGQRC